MLLQHTAQVDAQQRGIVLQRRCQVGSSIRADRVACPCGRSEGLEGLSNEDFWWKFGPEHKPINQIENLRVGCKVAK